MRAKLLKMKLPPLAAGAVKFSYINKFIFSLYSSCRPAYE